MSDGRRTFRLDHGFSEGDHIIFCLPERGGKEYVRQRVASLEWLPSTEDRPARHIITLECLELDLEST